MKRKEKPVKKNKDNKPVKNKSYINQG